jgi:hypothetical protein
MLLGDQIKEDEIDGVCAKLGRNSAEMSTTREAISCKATR